jgi:[NiFe] hydrogenase assembly HybE family chaperone
VISPGYLARGLERVFSRIHRERMHGVPILNPALRVQCVGFRPWGEHCLGVLITPWFLNIVLLPCEPDAWDGLRVGQKVLHGFPSGPYELIVGHEDDIGRYQMCSLFSPVFEFEDQAAAVAVAEVVLQGLMNEDNRDGTSMREQEIARIWQGEPETADDPPEPEPLMARSLRRRDLLRGRLSGNGE